MDLKDYKLKEYTPFAKPSKATMEKIKEKNITFSNYNVKSDSSINSKIPLVKELIEYSIQLKKIEIRKKAFFKYFFMFIFYKMVCTAISFLKLFNKEK